MAFRIGQKVVCIVDGKTQRWTLPEDQCPNAPAPNEVYTVRELGIDGDGYPWMRLVEIVNPRRYFKEGLFEARFNVAGFRPVTSLKVFDDMLAKLPART